MFVTRFRARVHSIYLTVAMLAALLFAPPAALAADPVPGADFTLTILHNNDGESQLINAGSGLEDFGGVARFKTLVDGLRADATASGNGVLMLSSGDNFLAGPEFNASLEGGIPFFDALAIEAIGYDAISLGNHDFDFGPDILEQFLSSYTSAPQYLVSNLNFAGEPGLQAFVDSGVIAPSTVVTTGGEQIGIVGAITTGLRSISSPRNTIIDFNVRGAIQTEVDALIASGVNKIIVISHLQGIDEDIALAAGLTGVDVMIAGGGDELLANDGDALVPGEEDDVFGAYPLFATDADGNQIPVVTTPGEYKYVGRLSVGFDADGNVVGIGADSGPKVVDGTLTPDADLQTTIVDPVAAAVADLDATVIGTSEVALDGTRTGVRGVETNQGNLIADALLWQATELAGEFFVDPPDVALQNGGGIRNNTVIEAGDLTALDTFDMVPFPNFVSVIPDIPRDQFKEILENAYSNVPGDGRFAQVAGFEVVYDPNATAMVTDEDTGEVTQVGERIRSVILDDGTVIVEDGAVVAGDDLTIATIDFLARGGDQYPYRGASFTVLGVSYQQALANYITEALGGTVTAADYPEGGEGRITALEAPLELVILHNNDGESQLINAGSGREAFGGVARFARLVGERRQLAADTGAGSVLLSSGDNFLAGPEFNASLEKGVPYYDTIALDKLNYDAIAIGNHDFDFGPDIFADFVGGFAETMPPYVSANLDFSGEPRLQSLVDDGRIVKSTVVTKQGAQIGIVGATTPRLDFISSPRNVDVLDNVAEIVQAEVDALTAAGVEIIIFISHLQDIDEDVALAAELRDVDVMIAGGGDELLANDGDALVPGEAGDVFGPYPVVATDADGNEVPVVTTPGEYKYLGELRVSFDPDGIATSWEGGPLVVTGGANNDVYFAAVQPVIEAVAELEATIVGTSEVALDGTRTGVRGVETNQGNLIADALLWQARQLAGEFGTAEADVALQNGGGIRNNTVIAAGDITILDTFDMVPFSNFVSVIPDIPRDQFKEILENAYSNVPGDGRFAQVGGFSVVYDITKTAQVLNDDGTVDVPGERIISVTLDDGTVIVEDGAVVAGDDLTIATIDFLARGGDQYPYRGAGFTVLGVTYQQALANYIADGLGGTITAADYPEGGEGRITNVGVDEVTGPFTPIHEIQGAEDASPLDGETVEVEGYVTGVFPDLGGFFVQDPIGDGDDRTSDGIFVDYTNGVTAGSHVELRGVVTEFFDETRIVDVEALETVPNGQTIEPVAVTFPLGEGASLERYEGMLVTFPEPMAVTDTFNLHRFGEMLVAQGGVLVNPTDIAAPGDAANDVAEANAARSIILDDGSGEEFPAEVPYTDNGQRRRGDAATGITANVSYSFGNYKLQPTEPVVFEELNPRPAAPDDVGGNLTVASFNVLNFFSTIDDGDNGARGADSEAEKAAQLTKLVAAIEGLDADIIGLQEIENNGPVAIGELVDALNASAGDGTWAAAADPEYPGGLETTNAIKVAIIFKPASVIPVGTTEVSEDPVFGTDRPPIAHAFEAGGETFTVVNNHFKSKSSRNAEGADLDQGDGQGAYNARRTAQAAALLEFVTELATIADDPDVLVIGDFNSYAMEDPIATLEGSLTNLVTQYLTPEDSYSLVFFGQQGLLDGAFATSSLVDKVTGLDIWHINADEPRVLQYNDDIIDPAERDRDFNQPVSQPDAYASSDHDPIIVGLQAGDVVEGPISLGYSTSNDRANPAALSGATVSGTIYAHVLPLDPGLGFTTVDFFLDGDPARTEFLEPYDFRGGLTTIATGWNTAEVADGEHVMRAVGNLADGSTVETSATFTVSNAAGAADFGLAYSASAFRTDPVPLDGATVFGELFAFVDPLFPDGYETFTTVDFLINGELVHTEWAAPYDSVSGGTEKANEALDTTTLPDGINTMTARANRAGGPPLEVTATFTVANDLGDIVDVAAADGRFTTLVAAVQAAGLEDTLRGLGPFTVLAPTDDAFAALPEGALDALLADPDALSNVLLYHVLSGAVDSATVASLTSATTVQGSDITIEVVDGEVILNGSVKVIITDVPARNGIIHVLDGVLMPPADLTRFATFNASLNRSNAGDLITDLSTPDNEQAQAVAEIIQRVRPEVLLINEFDFDADGEAARLFQENYLSKSQNGGEPIMYDYAFSAPSNTGVDSGFDLDNDGELGGPNDAFGFGFFEGQFGMQVFSQHPIDFANVRTFQNFLWADMPGALLPFDPATGDDWYDAEELGAVRLSSKSHWDIPIDINGHTVNFLASHPTPPVFDGPEDRNGTRNHDEIRFWSDYINGADYIVDDAGVMGGWSGDAFVIAGDQNADPFDGDSLPGAAQQLLDDPRVNVSMTPSSLGGVEQSTLQGSNNLDHLGDPAYDTADFGEAEFGGPGNLRVDYVLPSLNLDIVDSGVFWPEAADPAFSLVGTFPFPSSDHRLVWIDIAKGATPLPPPMPPVELPSIFEIASGDDRFETLTTALEMAGLDTVLDEQGPFTVFAPTDAAFEDLPEELLADALADPGFLEAILLYHVLDGAVASGELAAVTEAPTLLGPSIAVEVFDGVVILDGVAAVVITDIPASNGVVHVIDLVLLPPPPPEPLGFLVAEWARGTTEVPAIEGLSSLSMTFLDVFTLDDTSYEFCFSMNTSIVNPTAAHIHRGVAGENGPVVVDTGFTAESFIPDEFVPADKQAEGCVPVEQALGDEILATPGAFYFNVHSVENPAGENREQFFDATGFTGPPVDFTGGPWRGDEVVPGPGDPDANGRIAFTLPETDNGEICFNSFISQAGQPTGGYLAAGASGEASTLPADLLIGSLWPVILEPFNQQQWIVNGCAPVPAEVLAGIMATPAAYHAQITNDEFVDGIARAQLAAGLGDENVLLAELSPLDGVDPAANGFTPVVLFPEQDYLCWGVDVTGIGEPTKVEINSNVAMLVEFDLSGAPFLPSQNADFTSFGCQPADSLVVDDILAAPGDHQVVVYNADGPALAGPIFDPEAGPGPVPPPRDPDSIPLPNGFQPEGVALGNGTDIFAGSLATGVIYKADIASKMGGPLVVPTDGRTAVGMTVDTRTNYLWVAGGPFGNGFVYDADTGAEMAAIQLNSAAPFETLVNDVIVAGDTAYFTDSFRPVFYKVALGPGGTLPDPAVVEEVALNTAFPFTPGGINANGIVMAGDSLIINHTDEGLLFKVNPATGSAVEIDLAGALLPAGDGLVLDGTTLYVVQNNLNQIAVVELSSDYSTGTLVGTITSPLFRVPTTADQSNGDLYAVNARFDKAPPPFPGAPPADPTLDYDIVRVSKDSLVVVPPPPEPPLMLGAELNGANAVPGPGDDDGVGVAKLTLDGTSLTWEISVRDIGEIQAGHIHEGSPTESGGILVDLVLSEVVFEDDGTGTFSAFGTLTITEDQAQRIRDDYPNLYINLHTAAFPAGAIRGNLGTEISVLPPIETPAG